jgi:hypothetical protein
MRDGGDRKREKYKKKGNRKKEERDEENERSRNVRSVDDHRVVELSELFQLLHNPLN